MQDHSSSRHPGNYDDEAWLHVPLHSFSVNRLAIGKNSGASTKLAFTRPTDRASLSNFGTPRGGQARQKWQAPWWEIVDNILQCTADLPQITGIREVWGATADYPWL